MLYHTSYCLDGQEDCDKESWYSITEQPTPHWHDLSPISNWPISSSAQTWFSPRVSKRIPNLFMLHYSKILASCWFITWNWYLLPSVRLQGIIGFVTVSWPNVFLWLSKSKNRGWKHPQSVTMVLNRQIRWHCCKKRYKGWIITEFTMFIRAEIIGFEIISIIAEILWILEVWI